MGIPMFPRDPRVLLESDADRQVWLDHRQSGIGGSDIAAIVGSSKYRDAAEVWSTKLPDYEDTFDVGEAAAERMESGLRLENAIMDWAADRLNAVVSYHAPALLRDADCEYRLASLDGYGWHEGNITAGHADFIIDAKNVNAGSNAESVVEQYADQMIWYMGITGVHESYLAILFGGQHLEVQEIPFSVERWEYLCQQADRFWLTVETGVVPDLTVFVPHVKLLSNIPALEEDLNMSATPAMVEDMETYRGLKNQERELGQEIDQVKARLQIAMGNSSYAYHGGKIAASWPEIQGKGGKTFRRFTVSARALL